MKSSLMSAKESTKTKFERLIRAALQDSKLNAGSSNKNKSLIVKSDEPLKSKADEKEADKEGGLQNSAFDGGTSLAKIASKTVSELSDFSTKTGQKSEVVPQKPKRKHRRASADVVKEHLQSASSSQQSEVKDVLDKRSFNAAAYNSASGSHSEAETSLLDKPDDLKKQQVVQAEVHGTVDSRVSPSKKTNHREHRRRQKQRQNAANSRDLVCNAGSDVANSATIKLQPNTSNETGHSDGCAPQGDIALSDSPEDNSGLGITIHRADRLEMNFKIKHPLVRVHIVDEATGTYLKKSRKDRLVTAVYENRNSNVDFIMPVMTQPFDFNAKRSIFPVWEETLLYNENFHHFISKDSNVIIFFEILDFLPMSFVNNQKSNSNRDGSWYRIAWAFLKVVGANSKLNCGRKLQLQLFHVPKVRIRPEPKILDIFQWWSQLPRVQYPATLYVSLTCLSPLNVISPAMRSMAPTQEERGSDSIDLLAERNPASSEDHHELITCGCKNETASVILIYEVPSGLLFSTLHGHIGIIYDINWSTLDNLLLSASADGTARIWKGLNDKFVEAGQLLPHPCFVYCSNFHPNHESIMVTGSYDGLVRTWFMHSLEDSPRLSQELEGHCGHVNTLCFNQEGSTLFSGDSKGVICVWCVEKNNSNQDDNLDWALFYKIEDQELLKGVSITALIHHPHLQRILIQSLDGSLRMFDYKKRNYVQTYNGCLNLRKQLRGCISPCGGLVFAGSEDGRVHVWNSITGDVTATYSNLPHQDAIRCVTFHPHDHIIAFCYYGRSIPVIIYKYNFQVSETVDVSSERLMSFNMPQIQEPSLPSMAATYLEKVISKLDSVIKSSVNISKQNQHLLETNGARTKLESTVTSWDTTFDTFSSMDEQNLWATAQHDYSAQRSDELTFKKGDRIKILHKESHKWWVGLLENGTQGYLPANYVLIENVNRYDGMDQHIKGSSNMRTVVSKPSHYVIASESEDESTE